jgi:hypothetical protein
VFTLVPNGKVADVTRILKAIHAREDRVATHAKEIAGKLEKTKPGNIAMLVYNVVSKTVT